MANNLFISYDLRGQNRDYQPVINAITQLGVAVHMELSLWYLSTNSTGVDVENALWGVMQANDRLVVIDMNANNAFLHGISPGVTQALQQQWNR